MTAANAALAALLLPLAYLTAAAAVGRRSRRAWPRALAALDLALWHHLGRSHAPAVFGGRARPPPRSSISRGTRTRCAQPPRGRRRRRPAGRWPRSGYSSLLVLLGPVRRRAAALLRAGRPGARRAGPRRARRGARGRRPARGRAVLFPLRARPGARGAGVEAEPDLFPGRTFFDLPQRVAAEPAAVGAGPLDPPRRGRRWPRPSRCARAPGWSRARARGLDGGVGPGDGPEGAVPAPAPPPLGEGGPVPRPRSSAS